jgi:hypothetical protein
MRTTKQQTRGTGQARALRQDEQTATRTDAEETP